MSFGDRLRWVILTTGERAEALQRAVGSVAPDPAEPSLRTALVVFNGAPPQPMPDWVEPFHLAENVGVPGGRDVGVRASGALIVGFLDDDAVASTRATDHILRAFESDERVGAVALRLVDEHRETARRHVPRLGGRDADRGGDVALFLGGACALRAAAYEDVGGYFTELFYGHEEVELAWRLIDRGWRIRYVPEVTIFHPRTAIGRHADGWRMTGRNRVMIARRTLPWPIAIVHVANWFVLGLVRAPGSGHRAAYVRGWWSGWSKPVDRRPIRWRTVWRLTRLGRPPIL